VTEISRGAGFLERQPILGVLAPFALVFAVGNYFRFMNAVLAPHLVADLHLTAGDLGLLVSAYFLASALFQAPLGLLMDRFGPRRVQATMIIFGGVGALVFGLAANWPLALVGRVMMGLGAAGGLMTSIQAITLWFPTPRWPFFNGVVLSVGALGSLAATLPTQFVIDLVGWRQLMLGVALAAFAGGVLLFAIVPERIADKRPSSLGEQLRGLGEIYRDRVFWRVAPLYLTTVGSTIAFQSLWAGTWLRDVAELEPNAIASDLLILTLMQVGAYVLNGYVASELNRRGVGLMRIVVVGAALYVLSQMPLVLPTGIGRWAVLFGLGLLSNINTLCYPMLAQHFPQRLVGRANTALNTFFFVGAFTLQYMVGLVIDLFPTEASGHYPVAAYQIAFGLTVAAQIASWIWLLIPPKERAERPS
jgi:MFS family permease